MLQRNDRRSLADRIGELERAGAEPFGVDFVLHNYGQADQADVELASSRARVVEFFWATPTPGCDAGALRRGTGQRGGRCRIFPSPAAAMDRGIRRQPRSSSQPNLAVAEVVRIGDALSGVVWEQSLISADMARSA
jgi:hypothetical protein